MRKNNHLLLSQYHKKLKQIHGKKHNLYCFSQNKEKWSVIHGKNYVVIDFNKNIKIEFLCNTLKKEKFFLTKPHKFKSFYMEKTTFVFFSKNHKKWSLIRGSNSVLIYFHKNKKLNWSVTHREKQSLVVFINPQKLKCNTRKKPKLYSFSKTTKNEI